MSINCSGNTKIPAHTRPMAHSALILTLLSPYPTFILLLPYPYPTVTYSYPTIILMLPYPYPTLYPPPPPHYLSLKPLLLCYISIWRGTKKRVNVAAKEVCSIK